MAACEAGEKHDQVAACYGVHVVTLRRWLRRFRETGGVEALPRGHRKRAFDDSETEQLAALVDQKNDATLEKLREASQKSCCVATVHNTLQRLDYRFKKNAAAQRTRPPRR